MQGEALVHPEPSEGPVRLASRWAGVVSLPAGRGGRTPRDAAKEDYRHALQAKRYA